MRTTRAVAAKGERDNDASSSTHAQRAAHCPPTGSAAVPRIADFHPPPAQAKYMIASLRGEIIDRTIDEVVIECSGVGYAAQVSIRTMERLPGIGDEAFVLIHTVVREDAIVLFGFHDAAEREIFRRLVSVSGVGPKIGLAALSIYTAQELQSCFVHGDVGALTRVSGVGKKTAQRMLLELSDKMSRALPSMGPGGAIFNTAANHFADLELALSSLGYKPKAIQSVLQTLKDDDSNETNLQRLLRKALKLLQR